jgi:peptidoglycan hydrolase CwlO-like protein
MTKVDQEWVMTCDQQIFDDAFHKAMISNPIIQDMRSHLVTIDTRVGVIESDVAELKADVAVLKADVSELKADVAELKIGQHEMGLKMDEIRNNIQIILDILIPTLEVAPRASAHLT